MQRVKTSWIGARMVFNFMDCPSCKKEMNAKYCNELERELRDSRKLKEKVQKKAVERAIAEGIDKDDRLYNPGDDYFNDLPKYALDRLSFYMCFTCNDPYYGGKRECGQQEQNQAGFKKEDLVCGSCVAKRAGVGVSECKTHGKDAIEFKCRYCCSVALWFCFGTTHFCEPCHQRAGSTVPLPCKGLGKCDLGIDHPPNG